MCVGVGDDAKHRKPQTDERVFLDGESLLLQGYLIGKPDRILPS